LLISKTNKDNNHKKDETRDDFRGFKFPSEYCAALGCTFRRNISTAFHICMQMRIFSQNFIIDLNVRGYSVAVAFGL